MRPGGQPNIQQLLKQAQKMQQQVASAQAELAEAQLTGTAGGGLVTVTITGTGEITGVKIDPKAVDPDDVETLEDLVLAALHNAAEAVRALTEWKNPTFLDTCAAACAEAGGKGSHVLRALALPEERIYTALRFGIGRFNRESEIDEVVEALSVAVDAARARAAAIPGR